MKKLLTVLSARASYSRVRTVLIALQEMNGISSNLVMVASAASKKYGNLDKFLLDDGIRVDWKIESQADASLESSMVRTASSTMVGVSDYILNFGIDGVLVIADRHETLGGTIASSFLNRKTFHLLGGEVSGNIDNKVRYANSFLSDFHFVATTASKMRLEKCGILTTSIFVTGCPSLDYIPSIETGSNSTKFRNLGGVGLNIEELFSDKYIVVVQHPETTSKLPAREQIKVTIEAVARLNLPALWIWPNSDLGSDEVIREITKARELGKLKLVHFERSIEPRMFLSILKGAKCIVGNSSVAIRECSLMGVPSINIGGRQKNRERAANTIDCSFDSEEIYKAVLKQLGHGAYAPSQIYGDGKAGVRIAQLIRDLI